MATAVHHGLGRHTEFLAATEAQTALKFLWVGFCITPSAEATAKISISIMLMRVTTSVKWRWFFISLIVSFIMITIASLFAVVLSCQPIELLWGSPVKGQCNLLERTVVIYIQGGKSLFSIAHSDKDVLIRYLVMAAGYDVVLATSPIFLLCKVQINLYSKILLCDLLALGFLYVAFI